jgi:hypothetical protein
MSMILVLDARDDPDHTEFVNQVHDLTLQRVTVHAPVQPAELAGEMLRALGRHPATDRLSNVPRQRLLAECWLAAERSLDVFVYGAWRLDEEQLLWLHRLSQTPTISVWLITHPDARNAPLMDAMIEHRWSYEMFRQHWNRNRRRKRKRDRPGALTISNWSDDVIPEPVDLGPEAMAPWPYTIPLNLELAARKSGSLFAVYRALLKTAPRPDAQTTLAAVITRWFESWQTPQQRSFLLNVLRDIYFQKHRCWLSWDADLLEVAISPSQAQAAPPFSDVDEPELALRLLVSALLHCSISNVHHSLVVARDGWQVLLPEGQQVNIPGPYRPIARAFLLLQEKRSLDCSIDQTGSTADPVREGRLASTFLAQFDRKDRFQDTARIFRRIQLWPIDTAAYTDSTKLRSHEHLPAPEGMLHVTYRQASLLRSLANRRPDFGDDAPAYVDIDPAIARSEVRQLARGGLVVRRNDGAVVLSDWLDSFWVNGKLRRVSGLKHTRAIPQRSDLTVSEIARRVVAAVSDPRSRRGIPSDLQHGLLPRRHLDTLFADIGPISALEGEQLIRPPDDHLVDFMVRTEILDTAEFGDSVEVALAMMYHPSAATIAHVAWRDPCDFCGEPSCYDARVPQGETSCWAWLCEQCYREHAALQLGAGHGRYLVPVDELSEQIKDRFLRARAYWAQQGVPMKPVPWSGDWRAVAMNAGPAYR